MDTQLLIDGEDRQAASCQTFERRDRVTGEVATRAASGGVADANEAVEAAAAAFASWAATGPNARRDLLLNAATVMEAKEPEFAALMTTEPARRPLGGSST